MAPTTPKKRKTLVSDADDDELSKKPRTPAKVSDQRHQNQNVVKLNNNR